VHGKSHRHTRAGLPIAVRMGAPLPFPAPRTGSSRTSHRPLRMLTVLPRLTRSWGHDDEPGAGIATGRRADAGLLLVRPRHVPAFRLLPRQQDHQVGSPRSAGVNGMTGPAAALLCAQIPPLSSSGGQPRPPMQRGRPRLAGPG
jgi:hypothetical protein